MVTTNTLKSLADIESLADASGCDPGSLADASGCDWKAGHGRSGRLLRRRSDRSGAAVVEFAVCLPILMVLILGSIEATSAIFLKQSLVAAAYEGVREAAKLRATPASANQFATNVLNSRQVRSFRVVFTPTDPSTVARGGRVSIEVSAPVSANSPFIGKVIQDRTLVARAVMIKE